MNSLSIENPIPKSSQIVLVVTQSTSQLLPTPLNHSTARRPPATYARNMPSNTSNEVILADGNYEEWVEYISLKLKSEGCYKIAKGDITKPPLDPDTSKQTDTQLRAAADWEKLDEKGQGIMELAMTITNCCLVKDKSSAQSWTILKNTHGTASDPRKFQLLNEWIHTLHLPNESLTNYHSRQGIACDRFVTSLGQGASVKDFADVVQAAFTLKNLQQDADNSELRKRMESNDHTTVTLIGEKFSAEQTRHNTKATEEVQGLLAQGGQKGGHKRQGGKGGRPMCDHCGLKGHLESKCWDKFPHLKKEAEDRRKAEKAKKDNTSTSSSSSTSAAANVAKIFDPDTDSEDEQPILMM